MKVYMTTVRVILTYLNDTKLLKITRDTTLRYRQRNKSKKQMKTRNQYWNEHVEKIKSIRVAHICKINKQMETKKNRTGYVYKIVYLIITARCTWSKECIEHICFSLK